MKQYNAKEKLLIVKEIRKFKCKSKAARDNSISLRSYYSWEKKIRNYKLEIDLDNSVLALENKSRKPIHSPNKIVNEDIINAVVEYIGKYKCGKIKLKHYLKRADIICGESAIERILKEKELWHYKKKPNSKLHKGKYIQTIKKVGEKVQIDLKYAYFGKVQYYQFTAVDMASRFAFAWLYQEKTPENARDFVEKLIRFFPFKI